MRHCPDCRLRFADRRDVCPECWCGLEPGPPPDPRRLTLVFETGAFYEADLLEVALAEEGIPCLRLPRLPWLPSLSGLRLYVREEAAPAAREIIDEVLGRRETEA